MCFMIKRYAACVVFGHCIKEMPSYDRETCEQARAEGAFGFCKEVKAKFVPEFTCPFCPTCSSMENWFFNRAKASVAANRAAGSFEKPIFTESLLVQFRGMIDAPDHAPVATVATLTSSMETRAVTSTEEREAELAKSWVNRHMRLASAQVSMEGLTEQFASWVTAVYRLSLVEDAIFIAKCEQEEHRLQLLRMLAMEAEVLGCYKARLEYLGVWQLFLSFAGIITKPEIETQNDDDSSSIIEACLPGLLVFSHSTPRFTIAGGVNRYSCEESATDQSEGIGPANTTLTMPPYHYNPLRDSEIRLLTLWGSHRKTDEIVITFKTFEQSAAPEYECLSYVWGSEEHLKEVEVESSVPGSLFVTQNLDVAIRHLRYPDAPRTMWIDAVCIDQANVDERSQQVARMDRIFTKATRVLFWLGPEANQSALGMQALGWLGSRVWIDEYQMPRALDPLDDERYRLSDQFTSAPFSDEEWLGSVEVMCRPLFTRLWVRQEIFLAGPSSIVQCGNAEMPWLRLLAAVQCLQLKSHPPTIHGQHLVVRDFMWTFHWRFDLSSLRRTFGSTICKDPRDRIYAVRAFLRREPELDIIPDYTLSVRKVYQDTVERYLALYQDLTILSECRYSQDGTAKPTWVPDWSDNSLKEQRNLWGRMVVPPLKIPIEQPVEGVLQIAGVSAATIMTLVQTPFNVDWSWSGQTPNTSIEDAELEAYARTFVCGRIADAYEPPWRHLSYLADSIEFLKGELAREDAPRHSTNDTKYIQFAASFGIGRQLFRTGNGDFGLAPLAAQTGDQICAVVGCEGPLLLRPNTDGTFRVIGECFMLSIMHSEALLGKLPDGIRPLSTYRTREHGYRYGFINTDTREVSFEDPRLEKLGLDLTDYRQELAQDPAASLTVDFGTLQRVNPAIRYFDLV
ncbi:hypothetical protein PG993_004343 [Apiospora rasikravindrae]|uniref:Heterokaryon incompatibility domain-containing protein n=1 Tax=Apiospora rasikravindrae TaxID=990691 RepID=A0ABR1TCH1_9PEZI